MKQVLVLILCFASIATYAQNKYGLTPANYEGYLKSVKADPKKELVEDRKSVV